MPSLVARFINRKLARKAAEEKSNVKVAGKKVELARTNPKKDAAVEELKEAKEALRIAKLEHTPLFSPTASYLLKCHQGDELFPCSSADVCSLCKKPEKATKGVINKGHHLGEDPAVWVCDRFGHPKVVGCNCPKCTTEQGCKYFYYWDPSGKFPIIGSESKKGTWLPGTVGWDKGIKVVGEQIQHYSIPKVLPLGMYEGVPSNTDIGTCRECLFWDSRLQCPSHIAGGGYWVLLRHYPLHLEEALAAYPPAWKGTPAPMLKQQRDFLTDARKISLEDALDKIEGKMMQEKVKAIYSSPPAKPHIPEEREIEEDLLIRKVIQVDQEYKAIKEKKRTGVLTFS